MGKDNFKETLIIKEADDSSLNLEKFDYGEIAENIIKDKINAYIDDSNIIKENSNVPIETIPPPPVDLDSNEPTISNQNTRNFSGPFAEVFDSKDIVNRIKTSDYIVDDLLKRKQEQEKLEKSKQHFYISKAELDSIINDNPRMQMFKKNDNNELEEVNATLILQILLSNLKSSDSDNLIEIAIPTNPDQPAAPPLSLPSIKDNNNPNDDYIVPQAFSDDDEDTYYMSEEDAEAKLQKERMEMTLKSVQDVIDKLTEEEKYLPPDELFKEFLQENFKDFLLAKKISGNNQVKFSDKIVPKENIQDNHQTVEISDLNKSQLIKAGERTSVLINRDSDLNIESIEVLCKCGEKTLIRFIEQDEKPTDERVKNKSYTDVVLDTIEVAPINPDTAIEEEYANFNEKLSDEELNEMQSFGEDFDKI